MSRLFALLFILQFAYNCKAGTDTLHIGTNTGYTPPYLYWLKSDSSSQTAEQAIEAIANYKFKKWNKISAFTQGITANPFWILLIVKDTSATEAKNNYLWSFYVTSCKYEFYELDSMLTKKRILYSDTYQPLNIRPYPVRSVSFPFSISKNEVKYLLVKAQATNTDVLFLDQDISKPEEFLKWEINYTGLLNRYFGVFIFALLINILLFIFFNAKLYLWLSLYISCFLLYNLNDFGFDVLIFPEWIFVNFAKIPKFLWVIGATSCSFNIVNRFTRQEAKYQRWHNGTLYFIRILIIYFIICLISHLIIPDPRNIFLIFTRFSGYLLLAVAFLFQMTNLLFLSFSGNKAGIFFLFSTGPLYISACIYIFYLYTNIPVPVIWPSNVLNACTFEIVALTIIFIFDYKVQYAERIKLMAESLRSERDITTAIIQTQERERKRIAEDLHDELGSSLAALKLKLSKKTFSDPDLLEISEILDKASGDIRYISHNLMPPEFEKTPLHALLNSFYTKLNSESKIRFDFYSSRAHYGFSKEDNLGIYRIIMELTQNIIKHSDCTEASVQMIYFDQYLEIMIEDNGKGMMNSIQPGLGLNNIQNRVSFLLGKMDIDSGKSGTTVMIQLPFKNRIDEKHI